MAYSVHVDIPDKYVCWPAAVIPNGSTYADNVFDVDAALGRPAVCVMLQTSADIEIKFNAATNDPIPVDGGTEFVLNRGELLVSKIFVDNSGIPPSYHYGGTDAVVRIIAFG